MTPDTAASDVPDLGKPFCTRCHKWGHRYTECPEPATAAFDDDPTDGPFFAVVFVKCPECGTTVAAMVGADGFAEEVAGCARHN